MQQRSKTELLVAINPCKYSFLTHFMRFAVFIIGLTFMQQAWSSYQTCNANAPATTPSNDFAVHNDGTVTHLTTGLMWKVCSEGQTWSNGACSGSATEHKWGSALQIAQSVNAGGGYPLSGENYSDWRLPNFKELHSIVELKCFDPAINEAVFPVTVSDRYWSSSPSAFDSYYYTQGVYAWGVLFSGGYDYVNLRNYNYRVRLVRSGQ